MSIVTTEVVGVSPIIQSAKHLFMFGQTSMKNGPAPYNQSLLGVLGMFAQHHFLDWPSSMQEAVFLGFVVIEAILIFYIAVFVNKAAP